jgi:hypothetical protein
MNAPSSVASPTAQRTTTGSLLNLDPEKFLACLNKRACFVQHHLTDHPLLALPKLLELARWLPEEYVRINSGKVPAGATPDQIPKTGRSIDESFDRIEEIDTRIMLKKIELHPDYRDLLHACLGEIEALGHPATRQVRAREGYVFLSAPNMTTPYHMDPEINFLLQTRGHKTFHVVPGDDPSILTEEDIERFYAGTHKSLPFPDTTRDRAVPFAMAPGDGVHIPVNHPHWVTTGSEVTISFAITMQTAGTDRRGALYAVNNMLRRRGLRPTPVGRSATGDFLKYQLFRAGRVVKACLPGSKKGSEH